MHRTDQQVEKLARGPIFAERPDGSTTLSLRRSFSAEPAQDRDGAARERGRRRKVLVIASRFPPVASVGATRVRKFVKYLGRFGWDAVVITGAMRRGGGSMSDGRRATDHESLIDLPPEIHVHRLSGVLDNWPNIVSRVTGAWLSRATGPLGLDEAWWSARLKWRLQRLHDRLSFPDRGIWRFCGAVKAALRLHRLHRFDAIFSSGMPFSDHLVGLAVRSLIRLPWLVDFRDPWVEYIHWQQWQSDWGHRLTKWCESAVVRKASFVVSVNGRMTRRFSHRYGRRHRSKFVTIANGFDPADFPPHVRRRPRTCFRLLHAGSLYKTRSPQKVLEAFRRFIREVPGSVRHARFEFAGRPGPHMEEFNRPEDHGTIQYVGHLSHAKALEAMTTADVNVILLPNLPGSNGDTTAKLYECLGCGRPILAAIPLDGAAADELRGFGDVWMRDPDDVDGLVEALRDLYRAWLSDGLERNRPAHGLKPMTRIYQAGQLATLFGAAIAAGKRPRVRR